MSSDELWSLYEQLSSTLADRIAVEKAKLEERLHKIQTTCSAIHLDRVRRPYPKVLPKYQNPKNPAETWSIAAPDMCDGTSAVGESRTRL
jgi:DNA-binding protein H-NS